MNYGGNHAGVNNSNAFGSKESEANSVEKIKAFHKMKHNSLGNIY